MLTENKLIGLSWAVIAYHDPNSNARQFWNLSHVQTLFGNASQLVGFKLMPLEPQFQKAIDAQWTYKIVDMDRRLVAFKDQSVGQVTAWKWDLETGRLRRSRTQSISMRTPGRDARATTR